MWGLSDALDVVRALQFKALQYGYHLALAGGVLNKGMSDHDLDLCVLPLDQRPARREPFLLVAERYLGERVEIETTSSAPPSVPSGENLYRLQKDGRIVDLLFYAR